MKSAVCLNWSATIFFALLFSSGLSSLSLGSPLNRGAEDTTSVGYYQQRFEYFRELFFENYNGDNRSDAEKALQMSLYYGLLIPIDSIRIGSIYLNLTTFHIGDSTFMKLAEQGLRFGKNDLDLRYKIFNNIGYHYYEILQVDSAIKYLRLGLNTCQATGHNCMSVINNLSRFYADQGNYAASIDMLLPLFFSLKEQFPAAVFSEDDVGKAKLCLTITTNLASNFMEVGDMGSAKSVLSYVKKILNGNKLSVSAQLSAYRVVADYYNSAGDADAAIMVYDRVFEDPRFSSSNFNADEVTLFIESFADFAIDHPEFDNLPRKAVNLLRLVSIRDDRNDAHKLNYDLGLLYTRLGMADSADFYLTNARQLRRIFQNEIRDNSPRVGEERIGVIQPRLADELDARTLIIAGLLMLIVAVLLVFIISIRVKVK